MWASFSGLPSHTNKAENDPRVRPPLLCTLCSLSSLDPRSRFLQARVMKMHRIPASESYGGTNTKLFSCRPGLHQHNYCFTHHISSPHASCLLTKSRSSLHSYLFSSSNERPVPNPALLVLTHPHTCACVLSPPATSRCAHSCPLVWHLTSHALV